MGCPLASHEKTWVHVGLHPPQDNKWMLHNTPLTSPQKLPNIPHLCKWVYARRLWKRFSWILVIRVILLLLMSFEWMKNDSNMIVSFHNELPLISVHCDSKGLIISSAGRRITKLAPPSLIMDPVNTWYLRLHSSHRLKIWKDTRL